MFKRRCALARAEGFAQRHPLRPVLQIQRTRLFTRADLVPGAAQDFGSHRALAQYRRVGAFAVLARHGELQLRPFAKNLNHLPQLFALRRQQARAAGVEIDRFKLGAVTAEQRPECAKRRRDDPRKQVDDRLPDHRAVAELRVVETTRYRQSEIDAAITILQDRQRQFERQLDRIRAVNPFTERQLVDHHLIVTFELAVAHLVIEVQRDFAGGNLVAGELHRIGSGGDHVDILEYQVDIGIDARREWIELAADARQSEFVDPAVKFELAAGCRIGRQAGDHTGEFMNACAELRTQAQILEIEFRVVDAQSSHCHRKRLGTGGYGGGRRRCRCGSGRLCRSGGNRRGDCCHRLADAGLDRACRRRVRGLLGRRPHQ